MPCSCQHNSIFKFIKYEYHVWNNLKKCSSSAGVDASFHCCITYPIIVTVTKPCPVPSTVRVNAKLPFHTAVVSGICGGNSGLG